MDMEPSGEVNILVCISASPSNERVIKSAAKHARGKTQPLTALYVDSGRDKTSGMNVSKNLALAQQLGARIEIIKSADITGAIKTASQVGDALILQYYEEPDELKATFGHELSREDWETSYFN